MDSNKLEERQRTKQKTKGQQKALWTQIVSKCWGVLKEQDIENIQRQFRLGKALQDFSEQLKVKSKKKCCDLNLNMFLIPNIISGNKNLFTLFLQSLQKFLFKEQIALPINISISAEEFSKNTELVLLQFFIEKKITDLWTQQKIESFIQLSKQFNKKRLSKDQILLIQDLEIRNLLVMIVALGGKVTKSDFEVQNRKMTFQVYLKFQKVEETVDWNVNFIKILPKVRFQFQSTLKVITEEDYSQSETQCSDLNSLDSSVHGPPVQFENFIKSPGQLLEQSYQQIFNFRKALNSKFIEENKLTQKHKKGKRKTYGFDHSCEQESIEEKLRESQSEETISMRQLRKNKRKEKTCQGQVIKKERSKIDKNGNQKCLQH